MSENTYIQQQRTLLYRAYQLKQEDEQRRKLTEERHDQQINEVENTYKRALIQWGAQAAAASSEGTLWRWGSIGAGVGAFVVILYFTILIIQAVAGAYWLLLLPLIGGAVTFGVIVYKRNGFLTLRRNSQLAQTRAVYENEVARNKQMLSRQLAALHQEYLAFSAQFSSGKEQDYSGNEWKSNRWRQWNPSKTSMQTVRIGEVTPPFQPPLPNLPVFLTPLGGKNVLFKTPPEGMHMGKMAVKALLCRLLATQPPGKVLFTFIDAEAVGQNAAAFMELSDYNPELVTERSWVEPHDIELQLRRLTEHLEFVNRMYLRGGYSRLEDYNNAAGEIVEPYRVLIVWDFPANFTKEAAERLVSIAINGPRCGVSTIVIYDVNVPLPDGFDILSDWEAGVISNERITKHLTGLLKTDYFQGERTMGSEIRADQLKPISKLSKWESAADVFEWMGTYFQWNDPAYRGVQLRLDAPPPSMLLESLLKQVGEASKNLPGVRVSFERIVPPQQQWWAGDASEGISVSLGRPFTGKIDKARPQMLELGYEETLQHAFVGGMVGSGKSVLLRVMIAGLTLKYSPDEVQLYLLDFKRVSFVPFVNCLLPHLRVVAIESDREFALSVLREIYHEFEARKKRYTELGLARNTLVETVAQYKRISGQKLPRVILIIDELQVLVSVEDEVKAEALRLMTRIVKEGRSFGIHLILATQTLTGADMHEVTREFISQFGIRLALKCSDEDARRMLADDNPAAKELLGKGHAIYNAKGGIKSANIEFQGAMFSEQDSSYLEDVLSLAARRSFTPTWKQIVFKGYENASVSANEQLNYLVSSLTWQEPTNEMSIWLGEPMDLTTQTSVNFKRESRNNLLLLGMQQDYARGILVTALVTLAAQYRPGSVCFYVLDFSSDSTFRSILARDVGRVGMHTMQVVRWSETVNVAITIRQEIQAREDAIELEETKKQDADVKPDIYLFMYGLPKDRDMMRPVSSESSDTLGEVLYTILQDGPQHGVHTLLWCDRRVNLETRFDRWALDAFDKRVLFQMPVDDVREVVGERVASPGAERALFHSEDESRLEKFRPYPLPSEEWLQAAIQVINQKH